MAASFFSPVPFAFAIMHRARSSCGAALAGGFRPAPGSFGRPAPRLRVTAQFQRQRLRRGEQILLQRGPPFCSDNPALIKVERPGDLNLNRMDSVRGRAEMLGDISPSEWLVASHTIARTLEARFQNVNNEGRRACAISVAQHNIESTDISGVRGHR